MGQCSSHIKTRFTLTHTVLAALVGLVTSVTDAAETASQVLTHSVTTDVRVQATLVDV